MSKKRFNDFGKSGEYKLWIYDSDQSTAVKQNHLHVANIYLEQQLVI